MSRIERFLMACVAGMLAFGWIWWIVAGFARGFPSASGELWADREPAAKLILTTAPLLVLNMFLEYFRKGGSGSG